MVVVTATTAAAAMALGGAVGLAVAVGALAVALAGEILRLVGARSRPLRDELLQRLAGVQAEHTDEAVDARSHDPFAHVGRMLGEYTPPSESVARSLAELHEALARVDLRLERTRSQRERWSVAGPPELIGGLAGVSESGIGLRRYGDPANLPRWLPGRSPRRAVLRVGRVLDDVRLLNSVEIEWAVLTFTLWARALLLVLAPALGSLSFAPPPQLSGDPARLAPWVIAVGWAFATALVAPRIATLAMEASPSGARVRRLLLAVELPLAIGVALTAPGWPAIAFAAGWTNWWQRVGRTSAVPDFSWVRLAAWIAITVCVQVAGLVLATGDVQWWQAALEVSVALGVVAIIGGSYGAMLPASAGVAVRVLLAGASHRRRAGTEAQRLIDDTAEAMIRAADELAALDDRGPADAGAESILRRAVDGMLPVGTPRERQGAQTLGAIVASALAEGGHDMWIEDPRALPAQDRAAREGRTLPVVVVRPDYTSEGVSGTVLTPDVAKTLRRLLVACIVEARVHGTRRVQTILARDGDTVEVRIANQPDPAGSRRGRGRGAREIGRLAAELPGAGELFRGPTDRTFVGGRPVGELFGVRFTFTASDTPRRASTTRTRL